MGFIADSPTWVDQIYLLEEADDVLGGETGVSNQQAKELANRTKYLREQLENLAQETAQDLSAAITAEAQARAAADATLQQNITAEAQARAAADTALGQAITAEAQARAAADTALQQQIDGIQGVKVGTIIMYPSATPPAGYLALNGALVSRSAYAALWQFAQDAGMAFQSDSLWFTNLATNDNSSNGQFSSGTDGTNFRLPLLNDFVRAAYTRGIGSYQSDAPKAHTHVVTWRLATGGSVPEGVIPNINTEFTGGAETRPRNVAYTFCIKY